MRMKSKSSKIFSGLLALVLALTMMVGVMPMSASAENLTDTQFSEKLRAAQNLYPEGTKKSSWPKGSDCHGFGRWLSQYVWGVDFANGNGAGWSLTVATDSDSKISQLRVGDVVRYRVGANSRTRHTIFITEISGDTIYYADCNGSNDSVVHWRRSISKAQLANKLVLTMPIDKEAAGHGYIAHYAYNTLSGGSTPSHTHSYTSAVTAPTCTSQGYTTHTCSCGDSYTDSYVPALGHSDGAWVTTVEPTCLGEGTEKIYCTRCNAELNSRQIAPLGHDYASEVVTEATCKGKGQMKYVCKRCEFTYYDVIPAKGHNHEEAIWVTTVAPTCTASGEQSAYCPDCNELIETRAVEALGHDDGKWVITSQPGCESKGEETCYCTRCGKVIDSRPIDALGHDDGTWVVVTKPTCREDGQEVLFCTRCGKAIDKRTVNALGHDEGVWKIDFEPTANHDGQMSRYCTRCDEVLETKSFKMHTHREGYRETVTEATCTTDGIGGIYCADCGAKYDTYVISALGHDYNDWYMNNNGTHSRTCSRCHNFESENCDFEVTVKEATCTEAGYTTHVCKICGYTYVDGNVDALGHAWGEWVDDGNGETHTRTCSGCGITETEEHHWGEWKLNKDATLFKNGTKTRVCPDCGATETIGSIHTAWLVRIPYTIVLWIGNILKKVLYILSFQWFLPNHGIPPIH